METPKQEGRGGGSRVILANFNGSTAAVGGGLRGVKHAVWLHIITLWAHALLIVFVLVQAFGASPPGR